MRVAGEVHEVGAGIDGIDDDVAFDEDVIAAGPEAHAVVVRLVEGHVANIAGRMHLDGAVLVAAVLDIAVDDDAVFDVEAVVAVGDGNLSAFEIEDGAVADDGDVLAGELELGGDAVEGAADPEPAGVGDAGFELDVAVVPEGGGGEVVHLLEGCGACFGKRHQCGGKGQCDALPVMESVALTHDVFRYVGGSAAWTGADGRGHVRGECHQDKP